MMDKFKVGDIVEYHEYVGKIIAIRGKCHTCDDLLLNVEVKGYIFANTHSSKWTIIKSKKDKRYLFYGEN